MKTEMLLNLMKEVSNMSEDFETFNCVKEQTAGTNVSINCMSKYVIELEDVDKELPIFGSYIIAYFKTQEKADYCKSVFEIYAGDEDFPYISWVLKNKAKNTPYKYVLLMQVGVFMNEEI